MINRSEIYIKWRQWQNYTIIGVVSLFALFFLPMLGSEVGLAFVLPNTTAGWIVYVVSKLLVAALNVIIFHCFVLQGKVNAKDNPNYLKAVEILSTVTTSKELIPRSPAQFLAGVYGGKGVTIFLSSVVAAVGLTQAVLTFDWVSMLTYLFTILMGVIFGILQMNQVETYWTEEYYKYAIREQEKAKINGSQMEKENDNNKWTKPTELGGTSSEEHTGHSEPLQCG